MANYRTVKQLTPFKGFEIKRIHSNGSYKYIAKKEREIYEASTLKLLKDAIRSNV